MSKTKLKLSLILTVFIDMVGFSIIFPIFPNLLKWFLENDTNSFSIRLLLEIPKYFSLSSENPFYLIFIGGIVGSIYSILQFIFSPIWGRMSDKIGRKNILIFTTIGSLLGYSIWLFSNNFNFLILSRIITGVMGGNISVASAAMADISTEEDRTKSMGMIGAGIGLGFIFGPPIGGIISTLELNSTLQNNFSFLTIYPLTAIISFCFGFINLLVLLFLFKETLEHKSTLKNKNIHPILGIKDSSMKELPILCLIYFLYTFAFSGFEFSFNFYLNLFFNLSPKEIGFTFVYLGMIIVLIQGGFIRRVSGKISNITLSKIGVVSLVFGFILLYFSTSFQFTLFALLFTAFGSAVLNPSISALASVYSSKFEQGKNLGILRGFGSLARAFAPISFGAIYFQFGHQKVFFFSGIIILSLFIFLNKFSEREKVITE